MKAMRAKDNGSSVTLWASANDTYEWANRIGSEWPCSTLSGHRIRATFDSNGLVDLTFDGAWPVTWGGIDSHELSACCADLLSERIDETHPVHFVAVGQFRD